MGTQARTVCLQSPPSLELLLPHTVLPLHMAAKVLVPALWPGAGTGDSTSFLLSVKPPKPRSHSGSLSPSDTVPKGFLSQARAPQRLRLCQDFTQVSLEFAAVFPYHPGTRVRLFSYPRLFVLIQRMTMNVCSAVDSTEHHMQMLYVCKSFSPGPDLMTLLGSGMTSVLPHLLYVVRGTEPRNPGPHAD